LCARGAARRAPTSGTWWGETSTYTVHRLAVLLALLTHELDAPCREERAAGRRVAHLDEAGVEVDLGGEGRDGDEGGGADAEDGRDGLVEEALVAVGGLLEDQNVAARALGGADLQKICTNHMG
jgi:GAF domain-containing protein